MFPFSQRREIRGIDNLLPKLIDHANVLVLYLDNHGFITMTNKKVEEITGKRREDIIGRGWMDVLFSKKNPTIKKQMFKAVVDDSILYKRLNGFEGIIVDANGNERLISWSINPILSESKDLGGVSLLEGVLFIGNDITELREKGASLKKIDDALKDLFVNIKEYALYVTNLDGNITYYGIGAEKMFGWLKNEIIFKHVSVLHQPATAKEVLDNIFDRVKNAGQYESEINLVKKDNQEFPVILTVSQFLDNEGKLIGFTFIAKDITERKKMEFQILQSEKLAAIGQLAAGMAHEINNPLFVISGRLEMLFDQGGLDEKVAEDLKIINSQADRIRKLVDRLLKFARQSQLKLEPLNINDVIEGVIPFLSYQKLPVSQIKLVKEFDKSLPMVKGELNQLQEVFINLLINGYQAMSVNGGQLTVKTSLYLGSFVEVSITDTGGGIKPENLKNIFMPFFSTKKDGTGLGLSICHNIIQNHGGTISVENAPGKGTTFIVRLPII
ncbi:MAG: PAS domain S-box protein [Candidatus Omnitrophota bacterium]|jgi:PAS domain S-box-containing protein|nr:MAG: PAS domain S-box protein [Candidatus Omnitrophota bacterium]